MIQKTEFAERNMTNGHIYMLYNDLKEESENL